MARAKTEKFSVFMPVDLKDRLDREAFRLGVSTAGLLRQYVTKGLQGSAKRPSVNPPGQYDAWRSGDTRGAVIQRGS